MLSSLEIAMAPAVIATGAFVLLLSLSQAAMVVIDFIVRMFGGD